MDVSKQPRTRTLPSSSFYSSDTSGDEDDPMFSKYACTPPSRHSVKALQRKRAEHRMLHSSRSRSSRSCTPDFESSDKETSKTRPSSLKLFKVQQREVSKQRELERMLKQDSSEPVGTPPRAGSLVSESPVTEESSSVPTSVTSSPGIKVESRNRFMSVCSRLVKLPRKVRAKRFESLQMKQSISLQTRAEFQNYFSNLMKTGNNVETGNQQLPEKSDEDLLWQSELKDLLWLELQAWISGRSPYEQDEFLFNERQKIPEVLKRIMDYRFQPNIPTSESKEAFDYCVGCLDAFCQFCALNQSKALYEVSSLLKELENVEELYPSGRAFSVDFPLYGSTDFVDRINAMCLWYNVSCLLQLKIDIIGHMLASLGSKRLHWPTWPAWPPLDEQNEALDTNQNIQSIFHETNDIVCEAISPDPVPPSPRKRILKKEKSRVQFFIENDPEQSVNRPRMEDSPTESWKSEYSGTDLPEAEVEFRHSYVAEPSVGKPKTLRSDSNCTSSGTTSETEDNKVADGRLNYRGIRGYVEKALKSNGLRKMLRWIVIIHRVNMLRAKEALQKPDHFTRSSCSSSPYLYEEYESFGERRADERELHDLQRYGAWSPEYSSLNLPQYRTLYLFLCRIPLDVIREALCIRLEQKPAEPSALSIRQLMHEFKEGLKVGVICKQKYRRDVRAIVPDSEDNSALEKEFNETLKLTLNAYLDYLKRWVTMGSPTSTIEKNALELEWHFARSVCSEIPSGEMLAGNAFCLIASEMLKSSGRYLRDGIRRRMEFASDTSGSENEELSEKELALSILRRIQRVLREARDQSMKAVAVTKMIRRDLEVAAEFDIKGLPSSELLHRLADTGHIRVVLPHNDNYAVFVPRSLREHKDYLHSLLDLSSRSQLKTPLSSTFAASSNPHVDTVPSYSQSSEDDAENEGYMILLHSDEVDKDATISENCWKGETVYICDLRDDAILRSHVQRQVLLLVVFNAMHLPVRRREIQETLGPGLELRSENRPSNYVVAESIVQLKREVYGLSKTIIDSIAEIENKCDIQHLNFLLLDPSQQAPLVSRWKEVIRQCFKLGFEYHKDVLWLVSGKPGSELAHNVIQLARQWMRFALAHCERGRGRRPKWAAQGLDFLATVCESQITSQLSDEEFGKFKESIGQCVGHIIGSTALDTQSINVIGSSLKSPQLTSVRRFSKLTSSSSISSSLSVTELFSPGCSPRPSRRTSLNCPTPKIEPLDLNELKNRLVPRPWKDRVRQSIDLIEMERDSRMGEANLIGRISRRQPFDAKSIIRLKSVHFSWQRGVKIGQGRFGKVYVAVNNKTGELMAMKEIALQPNDHRTMRSVVDELRIFEGIHHPHLVRYYGLEVHREEMIIFMEFCPEGTLENLVISTESGLPEELIRRYTRQLLDAVAFLHQNGIVHRDIKGANIFLTDGGNALKLGDFGCAAQIKSNVTMAGELQGFVGTQAFMAPEIFMHTMAEGHGRAADIWSVGCVVVEMGTGRRPWFELESNYAIMFKVGMGEIPATPPTLSEEGQEFLSRLLQHDPKLRDSASTLLEHNFLKVYQQDE